MVLIKSSKVSFVMCGLEHGWRQRQEEGDAVGVRDSVAPHHDSGRRRGRGVF